MGIMLGGFDRMGEGDSKKMQKLVLNRAKTNQTRDWPYCLGVAHFSMLQALKILIFSYSLFVF
jgi:hypothetical protein